MSKSGKSAAMPKFVAHNGMQSFPGPYNFRNVKSWAFFMKGDIAKLQKICDERFTTPSGGEATYVPLTDMMMMSIIEIDDAGTAYQPKVSAENERELAVWMLLGRKESPASDKIVSIAAYNPYLIVNNPLAVNDGRSVYGYEKQYGRVMTPAHDDDPFIVEAWGAENNRRAFEERWRFRPLMTMTPTGPASGPGKAWNGFTGAMRLVKEGLEGLNLSLRPTLALGKELADNAWAEQLPQVFLKQVRDIEFQNRACYQAITEAPVKFSNVHGISLDRSYEVRFDDLYNAAMCETLGLPKVSTVDFGLSFSMDFTLETGRDVWNSGAHRKSGQKKEKVAILGGGLGGVVTAAALTDPSQENDYDVTLYTMGWRLGGKGASGRNLQMNDRIEEHGLHIWFGCYDNSFSLMRDIYDEVNRPLDAPLARLSDAFHPQNVFVLYEEIDGEWRPWEIEFPEIHDRLGGRPSVWSFVQIIMAWAERALLHAGGEPTTHLMDELREAEQNVVRSAAEIGGMIAEGAEEVGHLFSTLKDELLDHLFHHDHDDLSRRDAMHAAREAGVGPAEMARRVHQTMTRHGHEKVKASWGARGMADLIGLACETAWADLKDQIPENDEARRGFILFYLGATISRGILLDDLQDNGVCSINSIEGRDWLRKHAALPDDEPKNPNELAFNSAPVRALYDAAFAYSGGDNSNPNFSAATFLRACLWLPFSYKGSFCYEMQAGMGDTVFTPLYQALKARGVKFKFFSQVQDIEADATGQKVQSITIQEQVKLDGVDYEPLVDVKGLPCWPSKPLFDQFADGKALEKSGANLEHYGSGWKNTGATHTLTAGKDFDRVVMAIPLPAHEHVCADLANKRPAWREAIDNVEATRTCAVQLWFGPDRQELGYDMPPAVNGSFVEPWSSLADFSHLIGRENWGKGDVNYLLYTCGVFPFDVADTQDEAFGWVTNSITGFLEKDIKALLPKATKSGGAFDYGVLFDAANGKGKKRLMAQYLRANIDPNELYILSTSNGIDHRPTTQAAGLSNLYFAGDWTNNGFNISSVEGAVMSALQASRAISGFPQDIVGEDGRALSPSH